jgi:thioredoxin-related protein
MDDYLFMLNYDSFSFFLQESFPQYPEVYFSKVDIMQNRQAITDYKITQVPTIIFFDQNKEQVYRIEDIFDEEMIIKAMKASQESQQWKT